jgi:hypothetical protein
MPNRVEPIELCGKRYPEGDGAGPCLRERGHDGLCDKYHSGIPKDRWVIMPEPGPFGARTYEYHGLRKLAEINDDGTVHKSDSAKVVVLGRALEGCSTVHITYRQDVTGLDTLDAMTQANRLLAMGASENADPKAS